MRKREMIWILMLFIAFLTTFIVMMFLPKQNLEVAHVYHDAKIYVSIDFKHQKILTTTYTNMVLLNAYNQEEASLISYDVPENHQVIMMYGDYRVNNKPTKVYIEINWQGKSIRILHDETPRQIGVNRNWYDGTGLPLISAPNNIYIQFATQNLVDNPHDVDGSV